MNIVNRQFIEGVLKAWRINVRWGGIEAFRQSELRSARRLADWQLYLQTVLPSLLITG